MKKWRRHLDGTAWGAKDLRSQQCDSLQEHFRPDQPQLIPTEKSQGTSFFVLTHPIFFACKETGHSSASVVSSSPLREQRASQSTEFVLSPLGPHEDTVLRNPLPILGTSMSFSWDWPPAEPDCPPFPFCLHCCQGQNKSKEKMLLNLKLKNTGHRKPIALSVTKANPELRFLNHLCRKAGKTDWSEHVIIHGAAARKPCCAWLIPERLKLEGGISFHLPHGLLPHSKGTETSPLHCCTCSRDSPSYSEDAIHKHTGLRSSRLVS